ncbi:DUF192 domain-containing protein [Paracoccus sp. MBLB3053]|uniref:DUF192 domain-containing protein n=1 Tax=Paracoccus aurantius TaxID=3073814 RepID=A0ABU2HQJ8_9RHOB|nr:DUF192 domain-containing protein [Paracoccus sp. MBLB3053]MDS9467317.1 DUF192 domain-containing protein [Paracoccus sp. MBLB3053]
MNKLAAAVVLAFTNLSFVTATAEEIACRADRATFLGAAEPVIVPVEIADDPEERSRGLMFRKELASGSGMLFIYETPQPVSFWMRNTLIPLDMIFIDARGEVRHVHPMARPLDETSIPGAAKGDPSPDRLMVLEVAGGAAAQLGIRPGMVLAHPRLPQKIALARCD